MIRFFTLLIQYKAFVVAAILTLILSSMIYSRISILQTGDEIVLLSRPVDPRDLFRGNYVTMTYGINNLDSCKVEIRDNFSRRQPVFVQLEEGKKGYWNAVSVSARPLQATKTTIILSGYSRSNYKVPKKVRLNSQGEPMKNCRHLYLRYGLEKYFAPKKRAKELENMRRGRGNSAASEQISKLNRQMREYSKQIQDIYQERRRQQQGQGLPVLIKPNDPKIRNLRVKLMAGREKIRALRDSTRAQVAVIVRVSKSGEGAISGLMIDGKKVYDEPLLYNSLDSFMLL